MIYNYLTGRPITFFDFDGGLRRKDAITAATHFDFLLTDWDFKLNRTTGELRLDPQGKHNMEMSAPHSLKPGTNC